MSLRTKIEATVGTGEHSAPSGWRFAETSCGEEDGAESIICHWGTGHLENVALRLEAALAARLRAANEVVSPADVLRALNECTDSDLTALLGTEMPVHELAAIRAVVHVRLKVSDPRHDGVTPS